MTRLFKVVLLLIALTALGACTPIAYYAQSAQGHLALMYAARPIDEVLADPATPADLKPRLELARRIRAFAVTDLALPDNASYHRYSDLKRRAARFADAQALVLSGRRLRGLSRLLRRGGGQGAGRAA